MLRFVVSRILVAFPTLAGISLISFVIIQLPPGDYLSGLVAQLESQGEHLDAAQIAALRARYGLDEPFLAQYWRWLVGVLHGDFGQSFSWNRPVSDLLLQRLPWTIVLALSTLLFTWTAALLIGVYSAARQYSVGDYVATTLGFVGLGIPDFLLALGLLWIGFRYFGHSAGGLFSPEFADAGWNLGKLLDLLSHLAVPVLVLGLAGTAALVRILRANLLDEMRKPYVIAARARGMPERRLLFRYPLRAALNPFVSTVGWLLPSIIAGEAIVAQILSLPTTGPLLLSALLGQDMYLAGSIVFIVSVLTVIGTLLSDLALAWLDPRIRYGHAA